MTKLIFIDEHRNISVDPESVESVILHNADSLRDSIKVTMKSGDIHFVNSYYGKGVYETHRLIVEKINEG